MAVIRRLNLPVPDESTFNVLTTRVPPLGMRAGQPIWLLLRDTYFDTGDGALRQRGMNLRLRAEANGRSVIQLSIAEEVTLQGAIREVALETPVVDGGFYATLEGASDVSARVRDVVDPAALRPRIALDVDRETRDLRPGFFGRATHRMHFDEVVAHARGVSRVFHEVTVLELVPGAVGLETLGGRLRDAHGMVSDGKDTFERIFTRLVAPTGAARPEVPHDVRVSLMVVRDWEVALAEGADGLVLPSARGSGEELAREYLSELQGVPTSDTADLDLVGFATARRGGSDLEVWLNEQVGGAKPDGFVWIPLLELMERLGGPALRAPSLVAALLLLVRSENGQRLLRQAPQRRSGPRLLPVSARGAASAPGSEPDDYLDMELSVLEFNQRVLELAEDPEIPLLERFRFLSIFSGNTDEFFVVRVGRLKEAVSSGSPPPEEGLGPEQLLDLVAVRVRALVARQYACLSQLLLPALAERGIRIVSWAELREDQKSALTRRFDEEIFPLITPLSMVSGPGRSFPRFVGLGLALAAVLRRGTDARTELGYIPIPAGLPRFLQVPASTDYITLEDVVGANAQPLFPSSEVQDTYVFRATRVGDADIDEDNTGSLLSAVADQVESRPFKPVIRLEVELEMPREIRAYLLNTVRADQSTDAATLTRSDIYEVEGPVDLRSLSELSACHVEQGLYPEFTRRDPLDPGRSVFDQLDRGDILFHHPYQDFDATVGRFLREAAADPCVVSIKLTLYRTGRHSPVVDALIAALEAGKEVAVFVELKARFDEESNILWTNRLREAGARVVYGVVGYKTHAKTALVVRRGDDGVRRYVHVGTGNYNAATARYYTDVGLMSADADLGADLNDFFNELIGAEGPPRTRFRRLLVSPSSLVEALEGMIAREVEHARAGRPARIQAKVNGLADRSVVRALYAASDAGVEIDLIVRSICTLRPGVPGLSERIRVFSILGRFLEHSRIYHFENGGQGEYYIGSADLRARNLRRRVEVVAPVQDAAARRVLREILDRQLADPRAWVLRPDGVFERLAGSGTPSQHYFLETGGMSATD
jgi:polyphosphate kinase